MTFSVKGWALPEKRRKRTKLAVNRPFQRREAPVAKPTIRDVAEHAGVSKSLVSLVLRGSPKVSSDRRAAVERSMAELGYRPNAAARTLREGHSRAIGVLLNDVRHPWFIDLLDGLVPALEAGGRHLVLSGGGGPGRAMKQNGAGGLP